MFTRPFPRVIHPDPALAALAQTLRETCGGLSYIYADADVLACAPAHLRDLPDMPDPDIIAELRAEIARLEEARKREADAAAGALASLRKVRETLGGKGLHHSVEELATLAAREICELSAARYTAQQEADRLAVSLADALARNARTETREHPTIGPGVPSTREIAAKFKIGDSNYGDADGADWARAEDLAMQTAKAAVESEFWRITASVLGADGRNVISATYERTP